MSHLVCFGFGFSAKALSASLIPRGWTVSATSRTGYGLEGIASASAKPIRFGSEIDFRTIDHVLISAPPGEVGDPVLADYREALAANAKTIRWAGYLSTTGVYGDRSGNWVDETSPLTPNTERGRRRLSAETAWLELFHKYGLPVHIFRLAGIYGPGRNQLLSVLDGTARRVIKPGQIFSRIHVEDISGILEASIAKPDPGAAYNVCDNEPCPPQEAVAFAAKLLGKPPPPEVPFEQAELSPMARSFYADSKRVSNRKVKDQLGYRFRYATYREGLTSLARPFLEERT